MKIFLLAGQSNMQGCGNFGMHSRLGDKRLLNFKNGKWQKAEEPLHDYACDVWADGGAGMAMSFGLYLLKKFPEWEIGFVPCAVSGSRLEQWQPGAELFENAINKTQQAISECNGELTGILWHQGEADSKCLERAQTYAKRFKCTLQTFREKFNNDNLVLIAGGLGEFLVANPDCTYYKTVNIALAEKSTAFVLSDGLTDNDRKDNTHFDTKSLRKFGIKYAKSYIKIKS